MLGCLTFNTASVFSSENSRNVGAFAFAFNHNLDSFTSAFSSNLNEWFAAHTFSITVFSVFFLGAQTLLFMFVPDKWSLADTLILFIPASGLLTYMA